MASITPHKDGFRVQVYVGGVRDSKVLRTRREANAWGAAREAELKRLGDMPAADRHTLGEALAEYSKRVSPKKGGTKWEQNRIASFIKQFPEYAERPLSQADTPMWAEWRDRRLSGYIAPDGKKVRGIKPGSVLREINLYRNVYTIARREWKWIQSSPFADLGLPPDSVPRTRRVDPWKEVRPIVRWLGYRTGQEPTTKNQEVTLAWLVALRCGMRAKELRGLGKNTLNMKTGVARLPHKMQYLTGKPREIPLPRPALRLLKAVAHREQCFTVEAGSMDTAEPDLLHRVLLALHLQSPVPIVKIASETPTLVCGLDPQSSSRKLPSEVRRCGNVATERP
ncbi:TPA: integrase [Burkholderia multivorans]|nr:integrase [Burkholderia multivorans]HEF4824122.1 integrase [Burkholderia multivorans]HEJ2442747.1 integrase [Burkholderia multivorans]